MEGVRFTIGRGLVVRGRAVDAGGAPLAGADVKTAGSIDGILDFDRWVAHALRRENGAVA